MAEFTHINQQDHTRMVDVSDKQVVKRTVVVHSSITVNETIYKQISNNTSIEGDVLNTVQIADIMVTKSTSTVVPMCHPLPLTGIGVHFNWGEANAPLYTLNIQTTASATDKTGVGIEALTATSATALTIYDMMKAVDKGMIIGETYLKSKSGGRSGDFQHQLDQ